MYNLKGYWRTGRVMSTEMAEETIFSGQNIAPISLSDGNLHQGCKQNMQGVKKSLWTRIERKLKLVIRRRWWKPCYDKLVRYEYMEYTYLSKTKEKAGLVSF